MWHFANMGLTLRAYVSAEISVRSPRNHYFLVIDKRKLDHSIQNLVDLILKTEALITLISDNGVDIELQVVWRNKDRHAEWAQACFMPLSCIAAVFRARFWMM